MNNYLSYILKFFLSKAKINLSLASIFSQLAVNPWPHEHLECLVSLDRGQACWYFSVPTARRWPHDPTSSLKWSLPSVHKMKWLSVVTVSSDSWSCRKWLYQSWNRKNCVTYADFLQTSFTWFSPPSFSETGPYCVALTNLELTR